MYIMYSLKEKMFLKQKCLKRQICLHTWLEKHLAATNVFFIIIKKLYIYKKTLVYKLKKVLRVYKKWVKPRNTLL